MSQSKKKAAGAYKAPLTLLYAGIAAQAFGIAALALVSRMRAAGHGGARCSFWRWLSRCSTAGLTCFPAGRSTARRYRCGATRLIRF